jgi:hypothetical protein
MPDDRFDCDEDAAPKSTRPVAVGARALPARICAVTIPPRPAYRGRTNIQSPLGRVRALLLLDYGLAAAGEAGRLERGIYKLEYVRTIGGASIA